MIVIPWYVQGIGLDARDSEVSKKSRYLRTIYD